ncbi:MAG: hypothetical protein R2873_28765 [Caldilineaceae bacterium]
MSNVIGVLVVEDSELAVEGIRRRQRRRCRPICCAAVGPTWCCWICVCVATPEPSKSR